jgi:hypothetical protein
MRRVPPATGRNVMAILESESASVNLVVRQDCTMRLPGTSSRFLPEL